MNGKLLFASLLLAGSASAQPNFKGASKFANTITAADLKKHLTIVAGPEMEGRETGTEGQRKAAAYLETQMKAIGLKPGNGDSYQMYYPVYQDKVEDATLHLNEAGLKLGTQFTPFTTNHTAKQAFSELVFVNFTDSLWKKDKVAVAGKLVVFFQQKNANWGNSANIRINSLLSKGAAAALVIQENFTGKFDPLGNMRMSKYASRQSLNAYNVSSEIGQQILGADWGDTTQLKKLVSKTYKADVVLEFTGKTEQLQASNVLGILEGTDKKDEYVILTGHYDHIGKRDTVINYGADDDGSGTVSVLEMAEAFVAAKKAGKGPRRSIVFMTVSGEEKGLWGSEYYTDHPVYPLEKTTVNLNADMVGRTDSIHIKSDTLQYVYVVGDDKLSTDLTPITAAANKMTKLYLDPKYNDPKDRDRIYYRSDHYNFAKHGVPIIFYFDGIHADYHKPTDTVDKIEFDLMEKRVKLIFYTAWEMANRNEMLKRDIELPKEGGRR